MHTVSRVLINLDMLLDVALEPGWNGDYEDFDRRKAEIEQLHTLIETEQLMVYVPPFLACIVHMQVMLCTGTEQAQHAIRRILEIGNTYLSVDYERLLERSNTASDYLENADLYDVMLLMCGSQLNVDAIVTRDPEFFHRLIEANRPTFDKFSVPILTPEALVNLISKTQTSDLTQEQTIYAVTPQNGVIRLPHAATPIDFAYKIHTQLGNQCVKALVNGREVPLDRLLKTGDVVEIVKDAEANPDPNWLNFVVTRTARQGIHRGLKQINIRRGWNLVSQGLGRNVRGYRHKLEKVARLLNRASVDDLVSLVGAGEISLQQLQELTSCSQNANGQSFGSESKDLLPVGSEEQSWRIASCCTPLPGDAILGVVGLPKRMIRIHRLDCINIRSLVPQKLCSLVWNCDRCHIQLQITLSDRPDIFRPILNKLVENSITPDLRSINIFDGTAKAIIGITITSRSHLEAVLNQISSLPNVLYVKPAKPIVLMPDSVNFN